ncbi:hypothetical protein HPB47_011503 [Ixodes persulcatus]|uniref:Uncharacterized protein n=1 Tax=Ixodes persulcatus TaxID=34615 RepID=A0AC60NW62_IXOPE|nr:hypothetical protein HPB47_011503 [Ixodes persulcatus]
MHKPKLPGSCEQLFRNQSVRFKQRPFGQVCWNCGGPVTRTDIVCKKCDSLLDGCSQLNYFEIMGEEPRYDIDASKLQEKLHEMQKSLHPDRKEARRGLAVRTQTSYTCDSSRARCFSESSHLCRPSQVAIHEKEQDLSDDLSALVNQAYQILSRPEKRARYLLELHGVDLQAIQLDAPFLDRMMELNERVADMDPARDQDTARELLQTVRVEISLLNEQMDSFFQKDDLERACVALAKLMYLRNVETLLRDVLKEL